MNSSFVSYPPQIPFNSAFFGMVLYLIIQPVVGDNERGDVDANDDESFKSEFADELLSESIRLNKDRIVIMYRKSTLLECRRNFSHDDDRLERELKIKSAKINVKNRGSKKRNE